MADWWDLLPDLPYGMYWAIPDTLMAGPHPHGRQPEMAEKYGITHWLDLCVDEPRYAPDDETHRRIELRDGGVPTLEQLDEAVGFVEGALDAGGRAYVHCSAGRGRSGMVVAAVLADREHLDGDAALKRLAETREGVAGDSPEGEHQRDVVRRWSTARSGRTSFPCDRQS